MSCFSVPQTVLGISLLAGFMGALQGAGLPQGERGTGPDGDDAACWVVPILDEAVPRDPGGGGEIT